MMILNRSNIDNEKKRTDSVFKTVVVLEETNTDVYCCDILISSNINFYLTASTFNNCHNDFKKERCQNNNVT